MTLFWMEWGETIVQIIVFMIFFWVMKRFAWGPLNSVLEERRTQIERQFEEAEAHRAEAQRLQQQYEQRMRDIEQEGRARIQEAVAEGRRVAAEVTEKARREAQQFAERAHRNIELEVAKARLQLRDDMVQMTVEATERLMREQLDDAEHRRLVGVFIDDLQKERIG